MGHAKFLHCALTATLVASLLWSAALSARPVITFTCWVPPQFPVYARMEALYREAFDALGYDFRMRHRPSQRSLQEAASGAADGECIRSGFVLERPEDSPLLRVDALIARSALEVWSHDPELRVESMAALAGGDYRIGYLHGTEVVPELARRHGLQGLQAVARTEVGLRMLNARRLDLYIEPAASIRQTLAEQDQPLALHPAGTLRHIRGYPYLHRDHRALLEPLGEQLRQRLPEDGLPLP